jgi:hypothetical protein
MKTERIESRRSNRATPRVGARRIVGGALAALLLFVALSACEHGEPVNEPTGNRACMQPGGHCEYDAQCCSGRCYHETGCAGGTP